MGATRTLRLGLLSCLLLIPRLHGQDPAACPWGWVPFEDGCYGFFSQQLSWRRAEAFCQRFGADSHLASVHSTEQHRAIAALLSTPAGDDSDEGREEEEEEEEREWDEGAWIGLHHPLGSHRWQWSDGSELDYGSWHPQPGRACAVLRDSGESLRWLSRPCGDRRPFVCRASA